MNYHHLLYFYTIAKAGSITKACDILHLSQPALSAQLKRLEQVLKRSLFERHKKRLKLTEDGRMVLDYAERIFDLGQQLEDTLRDRAPSGRLGIQVGVMTGIPRVFTDALVAHILAENPASHIVVEERSLDKLADRLTDLSLDVLLTDTPVSDPKGVNFTSLLVGRIPIAFVGSASLVKKYEKASEEKLDAPIILATAPNAIYQQVKDFLSDGHIKAHIVAEVQDMSVAGQLASRGLGIAPVSSYLLGKKPYSSTLKALTWRIKEPIYESLYLTTRNRQWPNPIASQLLKTFRLSHR